MPAAELPRIWFRKLLLVPGSGRSTLAGHICPNCDDAVSMETDAYTVRQRRNITHTCPECGYSEIRL